MNDSYPVRFAVDFPDRPLNRLTTAFRIFTVIPIAIVLGASAPPVAGGGARPARRAAATRQAAPACSSCRRC
jgi:uncharacterized SAM-binding protein YcdF (DUF218 family)